jgi:hypothetical protein
MKISFHIQAELQRLNQNRKGKEPVLTVKFSTATKLLKALKLPSDQEQRVRLFDALNLHSVMRIRFLKWHENGGKVRKVLPPLIKSWRRKGSAIIIEVDPFWLSVSERYFCEVALTLLPLNAAAQNIVLMALALPNKEHQKLRVKAGIGDWHRGRRTKKALADATGYFSAQGWAFKPQHNKQTGAHWLYIEAQDTTPEEQAWEAAQAQRKAEAEEGARYYAGEKARAAKADEEAAERRLAEEELEAEREYERRNHEPIDPVFEF